MVQLPAILGGDVSGVVEKIGSEVEKFAVGDKVYYMPLVLEGPGSYAQYHVADKSIVARKPANLSHIEAASFKPANQCSSTPAPAAWAASPSH
jgi:NADPH2:quinone reductase